MTRWVGADLRRPEGPAKVTGRAVYVADMVVPGAWVGGVVRSPVPRGRLRALEPDPAFDFESVVVVRPEDIPGDNVVAMIEDDQPLLAADRIEHFGEPLALVAAPDRETLGAALAAVTPRIDEERAVFDMEASERVFKSIAIDKGDVEHAFAGAAHVIEATYRTDTHEQMYIEPQGFVAFPPDEDGVVAVHGSLQCPHYVQKALMRALALPPERARVVQTETGGGFGGKEDYPSVLGCHAALLAMRAGRPVRVVFDRHEDLMVTPKRHPSRVRHRTAVDGDGRLLAVDIDVLLDGGAYVTLSPVVLSRACIHALGPYRCDNVRVRGRVVGTNHVPYGAFRGFGVPQVCFAAERHLDRIAREIGVHPAEVRRRNMLRVGDETATGQVLESSVGSERVLDDVLARSGFGAWSGGAAANGARKRRGMGISFFFHGAGFTGAGEELMKAQVAVTLRGDGVAEVRAASTEIGQGTRAMFTAIAAQALGCTTDDVVIVDPDTAAVPNSGPTVASRTCMVVGGCVARACRELVGRVGGDASRPFRERARAFLARPGADPRVETVYSSPPGLQWDEEHYRGAAYPVYGWAADVAEVEVDLDTFDVEIVKVWTSVDVGKAIQPGLVEGQIQGGTLQAAGWAHLEVVTAENGRFLQDRMATCIIPTTVDTPPIDVGLIEEPFAFGPFGAKGVGELPMDGGAPAVVNAIVDALGVDVDRVPATPERLLAAWLARHAEEAL